MIKPPKTKAEFIALLDLAIYVLDEIHNDLHEIREILESQHSNQHLISQPSANRFTQQWVYSIDCVNFAITLIQSIGKLIHMVCCRKFEYNAAALREAFVNTGQSAVVYEQEVYDLDTFNPSFNLEAEIMHLESRLANLKYPEFSRWQRDKG